MFNKKQEEKDLAGTKRPRPKYLTMILNKQATKEGAAYNSGTSGAESNEKAENLQLEKQ